MGLAYRFRFGPLSPRWEHGSTQAGMMQKKLRVQHLCSKGKQKTGIHRQQEEDLKAHPHTSSNKATPSHSATSHSNHYRPQTAKAILKAVLKWDHITWSPTTLWNHGDTEWHWHNNSRPMDGYRTQEKPSYSYLIFLIGQFTKVSSFCHQVGLEGWTYVIKHGDKSWYLLDHLRDPKL